jgi:GH43 family beta-xylosidase
MTYFENNGKHYLVWAEKLDDSSLFMAEINPEEPWKLINKPILLTKPDYDWEKIRFAVNEGPAVLKTDDKVYVFFSASGTGEEYCMGKVYADKNADLMDINNWTKDSQPALQTSDLIDQAGPGHNSFVVDENGNLLIVYHARPFSHFDKKCGTYCDEPLYDPCRHARIKLVKFDEKDVPILK